MGMDGLLGVAGMMTLLVIMNANCWDLGYLFCLTCAGTSCMIKSVIMG